MENEAIDLAFTEMEYEEPGPRKYPCPLLRQDRGLRLLLR